MSNGEITLRFLDIMGYKYRTKNSEEDSDSEQWGGGERVKSTTA